MANQDSSLALDRTRLWERLRQEAGLSSEPGAAPVEALALISAITDALSPEDVVACENAGAALAGKSGALDQRLDDLQRWSDLLATILDESLAEAPRADARRTAGAATCELRDRAGAGSWSRARS